MTDFKKKPFFAIVLCTHNGEQYIHEQLRSIEVQDYSKFVIILNDWGSSDRTLDIVDEFSRRRPHMMVVLKNSGAPGPCQSFLEALKCVPKIASFDYILFCDQDDFWVPWKLDRLVENILESGADLIHHDVEIVDSELNTIHKSFYGASKYFRKPLGHKFSRLVNNPVPGMSMCFSKRTMDTINQLSISNYSSLMMHDWFVLLVVIFNRYESLFVDEKLVRYRQHDSNILGFGKRSLRQLLFHLFSHFRDVTAQIGFCENLFGKQISSLSILRDVVSDSSLTVPYRAFLAPVILIIGFTRLLNNILRRVK